MGTSYSWSAERIDSPARERWALGLAHVLPRRASLRKLSDPSGAQFLQLPKEGNRTYFRGQEGMKSGDVLKLLHEGLAF